LATAPGASNGKLTSPPTKPPTTPPIIAPTSGGGGGGYMTTRGGAFPAVGTKGRCAGVSAGTCAATVLVQANKLAVMIVSLIISMFVIPKTDTQAGTRNLTPWLTAGLGLGSGQYAADRWPGKAGCGSNCDHHRHPFVTEIFHDQLRAPMAPAAGQNWPIGDHRRVEHCYDAFTLADRPRKVRTAAASFELWMPLLASPAK
jgi:hypothetical protein